MKYLGVSAQLQLNVVKDPRVAYHHFAPIITKLVTRAPNNQNLKRFPYLISKEIGNLKNVNYSEKDRSFFDNSKLGSYYLSVPNYSISKALREISRYYYERQDLEQLVPRHPSIKLYQLTAEEKHVQEDYDDYVKRLCTKL